MNSWSNMKITYMTISGNSLDAKKKKKSTDVHLSTLFPYRWSINKYFM